MSKRLNEKTARNAGIGAHGDAAPPLPGWFDRIIPAHKKASIPSFLREQIEAALARLDPVRLSEVILHTQSDMPSGLVLTVCAFDYPGFFSNLSGLLAARGFEVEKGTVITTLPLEVNGRRAVVDIFYGRLEAAEDDLEFWKNEVQERLEALLALKEEGKEAEARQQVLEELAPKLAERVPHPESLLLPMELSFETDGPGAAPEDESKKNRVCKLHVKSKNSPFFLHSVSGALSLHKVSIESVEILTSGDDVEDIFELTDQDGRPLEDETLLNRLRLSVILSKQFTYFLDRAPDPARALERFDTLIQDLVNRPDGDDLKRALTSPSFQKELARLLGTSDFIWEDFIRLQHENLLPVFNAVSEKKQLSYRRDETERELLDYVRQGSGFEEKKRRLNEFKDRQSFLIDLDHILVKELDFFFLSRRLSALADAVVRCALDLAWKEMVRQYGTPRTAAGMSAEWAVFGLGKLGGSALGYASDIELLFIWSDNGQSDGSQRLSNRDFFERFVKLGMNVIQSRREGIFQIDLRLRPFGEDGPLAVKLESFVEYFGKLGQAHSAEKLALVRLRRIGGSKNLGERVVSIRDELIYLSDNIDVPALRELRRKQLAFKVGDQGPGAERVNAKFSPGALVDLEYNVQILQIIEGRQHPELRVPGIHDALQKLSELGTIEESEAQAMVKAYRFLRNLINALRMLRGNAQDLFLPQGGTLEYRHLARRMGYHDNRSLSAEEQLKVDFANHSAQVRRFVETHLGRDAIPTEASGSAADLILSDSLGEEVSTRVLEGAGFKNPSRAMTNLRALAGEGEQRFAFAKLIVLAWDVLRGCPDPDMALNNWENLVRRLSQPLQHYEQLLSQHRRLELLLRLLSSSQFLADILQQHPDFFRWITDPKVVASPRNQVQMEEDLAVEARESTDRTDWLNRLRRFRKKEILRIGLRDLGLGKKIEEIMGEISFLARAVIETGLKNAWARAAPPLLGDSGAHLEKFCVLAFGKLGGWELNYSSDIDLLALYQPGDDGREDQSETEKKVYTQVFKTLVQDLSDFTSEGQAYRVDLRLRPYGASGPLVSSLPNLLDYYEKIAGLWEHQALIKLKPVAGNLALGETFLDTVKPLFMSKWDPASVRGSIKKLREMAVEQHTKKLGNRFEVKNGEGGIRDIEFLVQGLQLINCAKYPELLTGNTLKALSVLKRKAILGPPEVLDQLAEDYKLLRRVEHYLQLYGDRQLHVLPEDEDERKKLALCVSAGSGSGPLGPEAFYAQLEESRLRVRERYLAFLQDRPG